MARITVEDCLEVVDNRFELVMMAAKRARQLANGVESQMENDSNDKPTVLALREQAIPPTAHLEGRLDPACEGVDHVVEGRRQTPMRAALSNSFAFGGSNAVLVFAAVPTHTH